jgi:hypothetical protein
VQEVHYVLDFYSLEKESGVGFHIDARPGRVLPSAALGLPC